MGHADDDVLDAKLAAALDDLLHRGHEAFAAVETEAFGPHVFDVQEFFEAFGLHQLVQDRLAPFAGKGDLLAVAFDPFLQPACLFRVRDMHVLQRECPAVGTLHDIQNFAERRDFEAENVVDEDGSIHVRVGEAVGFRIKLFVFAGVAHAQRVEIGRQMSADTVGADDHQRADTVEHRLPDLRVRYLDALFLRLGLDLVPCGLGFRRGGPLAGQRAGQVVGRHGRPVGARPAGARGFGLHVGIRVAHGVEESLPCFVHRAGIVGVAGIHRLEVFRVLPFQKGRGAELVVGRLVGHLNFLFCVEAARVSAAVPKWQAAGVVGARRNS